MDELARFGPELARRFPVQPLTYYADLGSSAAIGWTSFGLALLLRFGSPLWWLLLLIASIALLRAVYFIHELAHGAKGIPGFATAWFLLAGMWALVPSLMIEAHTLHHRRATYGTAADPEYSKISAWSRTRLVLDVLSMMVVPIALAARWAVVGPLSYAHPRLRRFVVARLSTLAIDPAFARPPLDRTAVRRWAIQEGIMCGFVWAVIICTATGSLPARWVAQWGLMMSIAFMLNQVRTHVAHQYRGDGQPMSMDEQVRDTITLRGWPFVTDLIAPLGDRFHALHHRFPNLPYHALPEAHRLIEGRITQNSGYAATYRRGLFDALRQRWRTTR